MSVSWLPVWYLAMEAGWIAGVAAVWGRWLDRGGGGDLVPLPAAYLTLAAAYAAGAHVLRREEADGAEAPSAGRRKWLLLLLAVLWPLPALWLSRHFGEGPGWLPALGSAAAAVWSGPTPDVGAYLCYFFLWWRGQRAGADPPAHAGVVRALGTGALVLAPVLVAAAAGLGTPASLPAATLLFLAAGLVALALARLEDVRRELLAGAARGTPARFQAGRPLLVTVGAVVVVAVLVAAALADPAVQASTLAALRRAGALLIAVLYVPLLVAGYAAEWLVILLRRVPQQERERATPVPASDWQELLQRAQQEGAGLPAWFGALRWVALALVVVALAAWYVAGTRAVRRSGSGAAAGAGERSSTWSWRGVWHGLRAWLAALLGRWLDRGHAAWDAASVASRGAGSGGAGDAGGVRALYRRLLALGREHGLARRRHQTPHEYLDAWREHLTGEADAAALTDAYARARYGPADRPLPAAGPLAAALARLAARLRGAGERA